MDKEYYDHLMKTAVEVFGNNEEEEEQEVEEENKEENEEKDLEVNQYESLLDVSGIKIGLSSDDEQTLQKARLSLTGFFKHYISPS